MRKKQIRFNKNKERIKEENKNRRNILLKKVKQYKRKYCYQKQEKMEKYVKQMEEDLKNLQRKKSNKL